MEEERKEMQEMEVDFLKEEEIVFLRKALNELEQDQGARGQDKHLDLVNLHLPELVGLKEVQVALQPELSLVSVGEEERQDE